MEPWEVSKPINKLVVTNIGNPNITKSIKKTLKFSREIFRILF